MSKNVKLGIRVRPFSERELKSEKDRVPVVCVLDDATVTITNVKVNVSGAGDSRERVRRYNADYTFDSSCCTTHPAFASQEKVFETIGRDVLKSVTSGCSACVVAYGQSATGKTHTMMGSDNDQGLIPRLCAALAKQPFELTVSFLEIYNERVHDLLGEVVQTCHSLPRRRGNARKDLRVREHPDKGPYVQNLRRVSVNDVNALLTLVGEGTRRRRTAATRRNSTSSRSHALLELATPTATLHLADLAGSEKASWEGCGGGRQKEGANINKSLVALSNVISALVNAGSGRGKFIPYRDSALTWLLKDCFTGGGNTFIIATVSPSVACYGESASTLRWAARARQLPPPRNLDSSSVVPSKTVLLAQFDQLLAELTRNFIRYIPETGKIWYDDDHWQLHLIHEVNSEKEAAKIGNIMELLNPKTDGQSESTASSVASGSSDVINAVDKNTEIANEIRKEVDKIFAPVLERTNSGSDLKVIAPLRHKRRQYKSQEVLPIDERQPANRSLSFTSALPSQSEEQINSKSANIKLSVPIPVLYDSQRAEIVASVTERLYSKLKKKEEAAVAKVESVVDKKIMEPLSELRICTNARQRLIELSHRAVRNKRRIGIPAHTQTRKFVTRVRDQGIDVQTDLDAYIYRNRHFYALQRDAATETIPMTPRCKEAAVGSNYGCLDLSNSSTITDSKLLKSSFVMTDMVLQCDRSTQTLIAPPPRRKKRVPNFTKYLKTIEKKNCYEESSPVPVININISQPYAADRESHSSDENIEMPASSNIDTPKAMMTPDLLTNHSGIDSSDVLVDEDNRIQTTFRNTSTENIKIEYDKPQMPSTSRTIEDFPDSEDYSLPRVTVDTRTSRKTDQEEIKDMILGRNENTYPYNIVLSPSRERDLYKRTVKFKDETTLRAVSVASQTTCDWENKSASGCKCYLSSDNIPDSDKEYKKPESESTNDSTTESSKMETDSFIWKKVDEAKKSLCYTTKTCTPVYRSNSRYRIAKAKFYKEFLGLETRDEDTYILQSDNNASSSDSLESDVYRYKFRQRRKYFEDTQRHNNTVSEFDKLEKEILDTCDDLEISVNQYDNYLLNLQTNTRIFKEAAPARTPTEYLQHLVQLRREVVKADYEADTSLGVSRK